MNSTHVERSYDEYGSYAVTIQHCEECDLYLGVNYPSEVCRECSTAPATEVSR